MDNFKCECGQGCFIPEHRTTYSNTGPIYKDKQGKELISTCCNKALIPIPKSGFPQIGTFSAMNKESQVKHLKARAKKDALKNHNPRDIKL